MKNKKVIIGVIIFLMVVLVLLVVSLLGSGGETEKEKREKSLSTEYCKGIETHEIEEEAVITRSDCELCGARMTSGTSPVNALCANCAHKFERCQHCGKLLED